MTRDGVDPDREGSCGTLFAIGNGRVGMRGRLAELPTEPHFGVYLAGFYDAVDRGAQPVDEWGPFLRYWGDEALAREEQIEACLVHAPNPFAMTWVLDGETLDLTQGTLTALRRRLDLSTGTFTAEATWTSPGGKTTRLVHRRFADREHPERVYAQTLIEPLDWSGRVEAVAAIDAATAAHDLYGGQRLYDVVGAEAVEPAGGLVRVRGRREGREAACGLTVRLRDRDDAAWRTEIRPDRLEIPSAFDVEQDTLAIVESTAVFATARRDGDPVGAVKVGLLGARALPFDEARIGHAARWRALWADSDVRIEGDAFEQLAVRFSIYHLLAAAAEDDPEVSIPAKGLTHEMYRGMVFWDTDIHMTPFFLFTQPGMARNLAAFRCRTLDGARAKAARYGFRGASYPWETGVSGREETEKWLRLITHQAHITADVAHMLQAYVDATGDIAFLEAEAAEVLIETARFWQSKAVAREDGSLSLPDAGGPDEFHVVAADSAYVNHLAARNLRLAAAAATHLADARPDAWAALCGRIGFQDAETAGFIDAAERLRTMQAGDGLLEQCEGFFGLRDAIEGPHGGDRPFETQCVKQADVVMLLCLLPDAFDAAAVARNFDYYEPRTIHASSLSHGAYGLVAAELGRDEAADAYIRRSLGMDLDDEMGNAAHGAHMAANGMNWQAVVRGYGGCRPQGDRFRVRPRLPKRWTRLAFRLKWRGADFTVTITPDAVTVANRADAAAALPCRLMDREVTVAPGASVSAPTG